MKLKGVFDLVDTPGRLTLDDARKVADRVKWKVDKAKYFYGTVMTYNKEANLVTILSDRGDIVQEKIDMVEKV